MAKNNELETNITGKIMTRLEKLPKGWFLKVHGGILQKSGIPDIIGCLDGAFIAIEVKRPGLDATLLQRWILDHIQKAGGKVTVAHSVEEALTFIGSTCEEQTRERMESVSKSIHKARC